MSSTDQPGRPPVVCTLTTKDLAARRLEWSDLAALAISRERIPGGVRSTYPAEHAAAIRELVGRELDCCGTWLRFSVTGPADENPTDGNPVVGLEAVSLNPEGEGILRAMLGLT